MVNIDLVNVPYYAAVGALSDMTDFLKGKTYYDKLNKAMLALGTLEGKHFAAPNAADVSAFAYNKKLLKQYGFDGPPKNYADMLTMCKAFAGTGKFFMAWPSVSTGGMIFTFQPMAWANGGSWISKDGKKMEINHPKNREAYAHYLKMLDMGCVPKNVAAWDWPDKQDGFLAGDVAMIGTGNFMINQVKDHLDKVDPGFTPFFSKDGSRKSAFVGGDLIAVPATTGNKEAALEYINFVLSREGQVDVFFTGERALWAVNIMVTWKYAGIQMVILIAGMQSIRDDLYEASTLIGASRFQNVIYITAPLLKHSTALALVISIAGSIQAFEQFFIMTSGGPANQTRTLMMLTIDTAFNFGKQGPASAISTFIVLIIFAVTVVQLKLFKR